MKHPAWRYGDKSYFNYHMKVKNNWSKKREELIGKADMQWPSIKYKAQ
ncbi:hypothetical protein LZD49_04285 [Dyadobacter sp. CY261]|nr:hypothetical protein [Dyadobacter sp. CY261]MCF0069677.1 hypothetical protein [Dyadobacter sp. CY261]